MTGFDETVPPSDAPDEDETSVNEMDELRPEHDSKNPELEDEPDPDEAST